MIPNKQLPTINAHGMLVVCAWCWPGKSLERAFPGLAAMDKTHGCCGRCLRTVEMECLVPEQETPPARG